MRSASPTSRSKGACRRVADGLTSVVALEVGQRGSIYAAELSKMSWFAMELELPGSEVGSVWRIDYDRNTRRELGAGQVILPGAVATGPKGGAFVSGPIFGPGGFQPRALTARSTHGEGPPRHPGAWGPSRSGSWAAALSRGAGASRRPGGPRPR